MQFWKHRCGSTEVVSLFAFIPLHTNIAAVKNHQHCMQGLQTLNVHISCAISQLSTRGLQTRSALSGLPGLTGMATGEIQDNASARPVFSTAGHSSYHNPLSTNHTKKKSGQLIFWDIFTFVWCDTLHDAQLIVYTSLSMHLTTQCKNDAEWSCAIPYSRSSFARLANQRTLKSIFLDVIGFKKLDSNPRCEGGWPAKLWYHPIR